MNKADLENLVEIRITEAKVLLDSGHYHGAYYLAGYALECALKACIARKVKKYDFPDKMLANASYTHNLDQLIGVAGLKQELSLQEAKDTEFKVNWAVAKDWSESARYEYCIEKKIAQDLLSAITDSTSGVLEWLKKYW